MKITVILILLLLWTSNSYGIVCAASPTNNDPTVINQCYAKMLTHFEEILKQQIAYNYANHLKTDRNKLNDGKFRRKYYSKLFTELEQIQRMLHKLNYPDPRPAVRCESGSSTGGS